MAEEVPKLMAIKSAISSRYAGYMNEGVSCEEASVFSPLVKIEVEPSKTNVNYVHLRFSHTNKYWAKRGDGRWIVAASHQPDEDTSKTSCTLFELAVARGGVLHLTHVQTGRMIRTYDEEGSMSGRLYVDDDSNTGGGEDRGNAFSFVDLDTLVKFPKRVAFVGDNGKYLQTVWYGTPGHWSAGQPCLQFSGSDSNDVSCAYEVEILPNGNVRFKSEYLGRFWRRSASSSGDWVLVDSDDSKGYHVDTWFWPVMVNRDGTVALRSAGINQFSYRLTKDGKTDCLNASAYSIINEARLVVRELVFERNIYNVRYRMEDARVFDEQPFVVGTGFASNDKDHEASLTIKLSYEDTSSYTFSNSLSIEFGVKTSIETGIPFIADGKIEVSAAVKTELKWDKASEQKKTAEASYTTNVPARSKVRVNYVATQGTCCIPFSYVQRDKSSTDGRIITSDNIDGIFNGINYYSFRFEQPLMFAI